jgi:hypothetical protein
MSRRARKYAQSRPWKNPADAPPIDWEAVARQRQQQERSEG